MASDTGDLYERKLDAHEIAIGSLRSRLAEAESRLNLAQAEVTMLRHFRDAEAEALSDRLSIANSSNSDLRKERDTLTDRLAEAMRLLAKEGIHMDDHGCGAIPL